MSLFPYLFQVVANEDEIPIDKPRDAYITKQEDYRLRSEAVNSNAAIVVDYFIERVEALLKHVLVPVFGIKEKIVRYEWQHRGCIHAHILLSVNGGPSQEELTLAFKTKVNEKVQEELDKLLECSDSPPDTILAAENGLHLLKKVNAAREKVVKFGTEHLGLSGIHPDLDPYNWPPPYGQNTTSPFENCLRKRLDDIVGDDKRLIEDYESLITRIQIHACWVNYCLKPTGKTKEKKDKKGSGDKDKKGSGDKAKKGEKNNQESHVCRFNFPKPYVGYQVQCEETEGDTSDLIKEIIRSRDQLGKPVHPEGAFIAGGGEDNFDITFLRNHPRLNEHIKELATIWRANTDAKIIKDYMQVMCLFSRHIGDNLKI
jgi:hypothetical protein